MKDFALTAAGVAAGVFCGVLLALSVKAGLQWYGCKQFGFTDAYCVSMVLMK
jgi:hypothetical protein